MRKHLETILGGGLWSTTANEHTLRVANAVALLLKIFQNVVIGPSTRLSCMLFGQFLAENEPKCLLAIFQQEQKTLRSTTFGVHLANF